MKKKYESAIVRCNEELSKIPLNFNYWSAREVVEDRIFAPLLKEFDE